LSSASRRSGARLFGIAWARQDCPPALRGLDPPGALPRSSNYRSDAVQRTARIRSSARATHDSAAALGSGAIQSDSSTSTRIRDDGWADALEPQRMSNPFFDPPIVNSPYEYPHQHWELDLAVARVAERVRTCGHDVPAETVRRRFDRGRRNFFTLYRHWPTRGDSTMRPPSRAAGRRDRRSGRANEASRSKDVARSRKGV
jgi:hypothetical protein